MTCSPCCSASSSCRPWPSRSSATSSSWAQRVVSSRCSSTRRWSAWPPTRPRSSMTIWARTPTRASPSCWTNWPAWRIRTCSISGVSPSCSATTESSTHLTIRSLHEDFGSWGGYRGFPASLFRGSLRNSEDWRNCSPRQTASWRPSTESARSGRRTSGRAFADSRRSTWLIATCRRRKSRAGVLPAAARKEEDTITELMEEHLDDLESIETPPHIEFEIGDSVVYPHHGAGKVLRKEEKEVLGESREYLTIKILHNDMTVMVPTENAALAGLRRVIDEETVKKVLAVLQDECSEMPKNWNRRFKHNRDKIKTGDIYELAEVVRNLAIRESQKGLSTGEKQMYTRAKKILASELMYALGMNEEAIDEHLTNLLLGKVAVAAK